MGFCIPKPTATGESKSDDDKDDLKKSEQTDDSKVQDQTPKP